MKNSLTLIFVLVALIAPRSCFADLQQDVQKIIDFFFVHPDTRGEMGAFMTDWDAGKPENAMNHLISACGTNPQCKGQIRGIPRQQLADIIFAKFNKPDWGAVDQLLGMFYNQSDRRYFMVAYMKDWDAGRHTNALNQLIDGCLHAGECETRLRTAFKADSETLTAKVRGRLDVHCNWDDLKTVSDWQRANNGSAWGGFVDKVKGRPVNEKFVWAGINIDSDGKTSPAVPKAGEQPVGGGAFEFFHDHVIGGDFRAEDNFGACVKEDRKRFRATIGAN